MSRHTQTQTQPQTHTHAYTQTQTLTDTDFIGLPLPSWWGVSCHNPRAAKSTFDFRMFPTGSANVFLKTYTS